MNKLYRFDESNFMAICDHLAKMDADLGAILEKHGYPPCWKRPSSFETLVHIILEQQVSLASALSAMKRLKEKTGEITPRNLQALSDAELRSCFFSRQKIIYTRQLTAAVISGELDIGELENMDNEAVRSRLTAIKGIGNWSADVYLMMALHRSDIFPLGDLALLTSMRETKQLPPNTPTSAIALLADEWKPYRTIAAFVLWHAYLCRRSRQSSVFK